MIRYAISMTVRVVCFILAVVMQNWLTWVFLGLAVVLPYIAVTLANAGTDRYLHSGEESPQPPSPLLAQSQSAHTQSRGPAEPLEWWEDTAVFGDASESDVDVDSDSPSDSQSGSGQDQAEPIEGEIVREDEPPNTTS